MSMDPVITDEVDMDEDVGMNVHMHQGGAGARLAAAREAAKLTTSDVASHLNLAVNVIEALEHDDVSQLPSAVFVRGYIKNYAQMVGIPDADLIQMYDDQRPVEEAFEVRQRPDLPTVRRGPSARTLAVVVALIIVVVAVIWWLGGREYTSGSNGALFGSLFGPSQPVAETPAPKPAEPPVQPAEIVVQPSETVVEPAAVVEPTTEAQTSTLSEVGETSGETVVEAPADTSLAAEAAAEASDEVLVETSGPADETAPETSAPEVAAEGTVRLRLTADSWVEVVDSDGQRLVFDLVAGGTDREVTGQMPMRVLLGRAASVSMDVDGQTLDLDAYRAKGIARFVIDMVNGQPVTRLP